MAKSRRPSFPQDFQAPVESIVEAQAAPVESPAVPVESPAVPVEAPAPKILKLVANKCNLLEPHENVWFFDGKPREVYRVTKWIQAQIDAGLLKQV
jgi:hypothetical protein